MGGYYYFNCNGPVRVGPYANYNEALQEAENDYGGPCQFLSCSQPPCGNPANVKANLTVKIDAAFLAAAEEREKNKKQRGKSDG
jgi:hypothetical protein